MAGECGDCAMCCKVMAIPELGKADGEWCKHICKNHKGCGIYETRPEVCSGFLCLWRRGMVPPGEKAPKHLRPDRCGVVFGAGTRFDIMAAYVDPARPFAWKKKAVWDIIYALVMRGNMNVVISTRDTLKRIIFYKENGVLMRVDKAFTPPDTDGVQWIIHDEVNDKPAPYGGH